MRTRRFPEAHQACPWMSHNANISISRARHRWVIRQSSTVPRVPAAGTKFLDFCFILGSGSPESARWRKAPRHRLKPDQIDHRARHRRSANCLCITHFDRCAFRKFAKKSVFLATRLRLRQEPSASQCGFGLNARARSLSASPGHRSHLGCPLRRPLRTKSKSGGPMAGSIVILCFPALSGGPVRAADEDRLVRAILNEFPTALPTISRLAANELAIGVVRSSGIRQIADQITDPAPSSPSVRRSTGTGLTAGVRRATRRACARLSPGLSF